MLLLQDISFHQYREFPRFHLHIQAYELPEPLLSMVAKNVLAGKLLSGCGILRVLSEDLHLCFVLVLNMLDFITVDSRYMEHEVTKRLSGKFASNADAI